MGPQGPSHVSTFVLFGEEKNVSGYWMLEGNQYVSEAEKVDAHLDVCSLGLLQVPRMGESADATHQYLQNFVYLGLVSLVLRDMCE